MVLRPSEFIRLANTDRKLGTSRREFNIAVEKYIINHPTLSASQKNHAIRQLESAFKKRKSQRHAGRGSGQNSKPAASRDETSKSSSSAYVTPAALSAHGDSFDNRSQRAFPDTAESCTAGTSQRLKL